jgi:feruloyl-CoA synthase
MSASVLLSKQAARLADPVDAARGVEFNRCLAEDLKLASGAWVNVDAVRVQAIAAGAPVIQDAVVTGHGRAEIGLLVFPSEQGCRALCTDAPASMTLGELLYEPRVRRRIKGALTAMATDSNGSRCPVRVLLMSEPPSLNVGEITDNGYVNQRAVLARRSALVERLHAAMPDPEVIVSPREPDAVHDAPGSGATNQLGPRLPFSKLGSDTGRKGS